MTKKKKSLLACIALILSVAGSLVGLVYAQESQTTLDGISKFLQELTANPQLLAAFIAVAWNIGGYITKIAGLKKIEKYELTQLLEALVLFETMFFILSTLGGVPIVWSTLAAVALAFVRSLKKAIAEFMEGKVVA
jgi:hypothetical protein